ncbi:hypothetical protein ACQUJZ_15130 [Ralstonia pseudosolanacearum]|uniref:hypothetical protein n=1 Tax=Ralstonia pseudosolanacearum TaxID=1310165 RepID=UPI001E51BB54|nr:hypothetical protein [Ralstonia pseudosolanacearum]
MRNPIERRRPVSDRGNGSRGAACHWALFPYRALVDAQRRAIERGAMKHEASADACQARMQRMEGEHAGWRDAGVHHRAATPMLVHARGKRMRGAANSHVIGAAGTRDYVAAQGHAFGIVFMVLSLILAVAILATKRPERVEQAVCRAVGILVDWRTWAIVMMGCVVMALAYVLCRPRR